VNSSDGTCVLGALVVGSSVGSGGTIIVVGAVDNSTVTKTVGLAVVGAAVGDTLEGVGVGWLAVAEVLGVNVGCNVDGALVVTPVGNGEVGYCVVAGVGIDALGTTLDPVETITVGYSVMGEQYIGSINSDDPQQPQKSAGFFSRYVAAVS
jgi:hypothetical protein